MNIGILTVFNKSCFSNGLTQNLLHLKKALDNCGYNTRYIDFSCVTKNKKIIDEGFYNIDEIILGNQLKDCKIKFDILLSASVSFCEKDLETIRTWQPNAKLVQIRYGNNTFARMQHWCIKKEEKNSQRVDLSNAPQKFDATLLSPHFYWATQAEQVLTGNKTGIIPYLWSPEIIAGLFKKDGATPEYKPQKEKHIFSLEPNIEMAKNSYIPLLAIYHILETSPTSFHEATITNSKSWRESKSITNFISHEIGLHKHKKRVFFSGRQKTHSILSKYNPLILSFQLFCELNYTYLESLHFGYPLVHNSKMLEENGYYYEGFNCTDAANQTIKALEQHDDNLSIEIEKGRSFTSKFDPNNKEVIKKYQKLMESIAEE